MWGTNTSHDVLALGIDEILTIEEILACTCVTREANTCSRCIAHVAEHHRHHGYGGTPLVWDAFHLTIEDGTLVHPRTEHGADGAPKLVDRIGWEVLACLFLDGSLEEFHQFLE